MNNKLHNSEVLIGVDVNYNLEIRNPMFKDAIGSSWIDNKDKKVKYLLNLP